MTLYSTTIKNIRFRGELYESGEIKIGEDDRTIAISQLKKSFMSTKMVLVGQVDYHDSTVIRSDGLKITIDNLTFEVDNTQRVNSITEIVTKPRRLERAKREKIISSADSSILVFILERAKTIKDLAWFKSNPREVMIQKLDSAGENEDPLSLTKKMLTETLTTPYNLLDSELSSLKLIISDAKMQRVYAMIYAIAAVQTAMLHGDDIAKPLSLLEKVSSKKLVQESLSGLSIVDATRHLYSEASIMTPKMLLD